MRRLGGRLPLPEGWTAAAGEAIIGMEGTLSTGLLGDLTGIVVVAREVNDEMLGPGLWVEVEAP